MELQFLFTQSGVTSAGPRYKYPGVFLDISTFSRNLERIVDFLEQLSQKGS